VNTTPKITPDEWVDAPPPQSRGFGSTVNADRLAALKERPGQWAMWRFPTQSKAGGISQSLRKLGNGSVEAVSRKAEDGTGLLYARYVEG
jgi:hypothetical protein